MPFTHTLPYNIYVDLPFVHTHTLINGNLYGFSQIFMDEVSNTK